MEYLPTVNNSYMEPYGITSQHQPIPRNHQDTTGSSGNGRGCSSRSAKPLVDELFRLIGVGIFFLGYRKYMKIYHSHAYLEPN